MEAQDQSLDKPQRFCSTRTKTLKCAHISQDSLREQAFFKNRDPQFLEFLEDEIRVEVFLIGQDIVKEGEEGDKMFFLHRGEVEVLVGPDEKKVAHLKQGSMFGELALLGNGKRACTVRAIDICDCRVIGADSFHGALRRFPRERKYFSDLAEKRRLELNETKGIDSRNKFRRPSCGIIAGDSRRSSLGSSSQSSSSPNTRRLSNVRRINLALNALKSPSAHSDSADPSEGHLMAGDRAERTSFSTPRSSFARESPFENRAYHSDRAYNCKSVNIDHDVNVRAHTFPEIRTEESRCNTSSSLKCGTEEKDLIEDDFDMLDIFCEEQPCVKLPKRVINPPAKDVVIKRLNFDRGAMPTLLQSHRASTKKEMPDPTVEQSACGHPLEEKTTSASIDQGDHAVVSQAFQEFNASRIPSTRFEGKAPGYNGSLSEVGYSCSHSPREPLGKPSKADKLVQSLCREIVELPAVTRRTSNDGQPNAPSLDDLLGAPRRSARGRSSFQSGRSSFQSVDMFD